VREDRERLAFAVLLRQSGYEPLPVAGMAQEEHRRLGERPLEMDVAHLGAAAADGLAGGLMRACPSAQPTQSVGAGGGLNKNHRLAADGGRHHNEPPRLKPGVARSELLQMRKRFLNA